MQSSQSGREEWFYTCVFQYFVGDYNKQGKTNVALWKEATVLGKEEQKNQEHKSRMDGGNGDRSED